MLYRCYDIYLYFYIYRFLLDHWLMIDARFLWLKPMVSSLMFVLVPSCRRQGRSRAIETCWVVPALKAGLTTHRFEWFYHPIPCALRMLTTKRFITHQPADGSEAPISWWYGNSVGSTAPLQALAVLDGLAFRLGLCGQEPLGDQRSQWSAWVDGDNSPKNIGEKHHYRVSSNQL